MPGLEAQVEEILTEIIGSAAPRKVIVAGPGTGKTTLFRRFLQARDGLRDERLVLTFINNLKAELDEAFGQLARVLTFHGYCRHLLHRRPRMRAGLSENFHYFPPLPSLIGSDWAVTRSVSVPQFVGQMRRLELGEEADFYLQRADYYDAVSFDDSVLRVHRGLQAHPDEIEAYEILLVDEYQDFNQLEASLLDLLATRSPIVIAGDDDQALYSILRNSSAEFIRGRYNSGEYARFALPFCMRCPEVIVRAVGDIVESARLQGRLTGRIDKPYKPYPPRKAADSARYPRIKVVETSVQSLRANYFGRYIAQAIDAISAEEITESYQETFPTVLIIGPGQYLRQVRAHLEANSYQCMFVPEGEAVAINRGVGLKILRANREANLGWRIVLDIDKPGFFIEAIRRSIAEGVPLYAIVTPDYRGRILAEAEAYQEPAEIAPAGIEVDPTRPTIQLASFEGSKGLSAQHVFVVGLHEGDLPRQPTAINDLEICKMIVAITRTRKQCHLVYAKRWANNWKRPSPFIGWLRPERREFIRVTRSYW